ncbi:MAG: hypothetical protein SPL13_00740 [Clostridia bacterium]|nr:hypothetical protein [Clostridia bacterium]
MYDKECKTCGYRLSSYLRSGYLNCPDCYRSFEKEIADTLTEIQGATVHKGKRPKLSSTDKELLSDYHRYLKEKEVAGLEGRFKDMSKINSYLTQLSEELKRRGLL